MENRKNPNILYQDENVLVVNKPSGMVIHPYDFSTEETLLDFIAVYAPDILTLSNCITLQDSRVINLGGIVHKLDRDTSGVMVIAKNRETFESLREQFKNHTTEKVYKALVDGTVEKDTYRIDAPLGRNKKDYKQVAYPTHPRGELRDALTELFVLKRNEDRTLVELRPKTGRTHQLRAHMAYIGHPIVGDKAYGSNIVSDRIMLHAQSLKFVLNEKEYFFEADIPEGFI